MNKLFANFGLLLLVTACSSSGHRRVASEDIQVHTPEDLESAAYTRLLADLGSPDIDNSRAQTAFAKYLVRGTVTYAFGTAECLLPGFARSKLDGKWQHFEEWLSLNLNEAGVSVRGHQGLKALGDAKFRHLAVEEATHPMIARHYAMLQKELAAAQARASDGNAEGDNDLASAHLETLQDNIAFVKPFGEAYGEVARGLPDHRQKEMSKTIKELDRREGALIAYMKREGLLCADEYLDPFDRHKKKPDGSAAGYVH